MRAREFIKEGKGYAPVLGDAAPIDPTIGDPMHDTFILPGIRNNDAYKSYRFSIAMARARAIIGGQDQDLPEWHAEGAIGPNAMVAGFNNTVDPVIDMALKMTNIPGGKKQVGTNGSVEPGTVNKTSPIKGFKGYR
jgi:hypothetical protein